MQEYIEAASFYCYLKSEKLICIPEVESRLHFLIREETDTSLEQKKVS